MEKTDKNVKKTGKKLKIKRVTGNKPSQISKNRQNVKKPGKNNQNIEKLPKMSKKRKKGLKTIEKSSENRKT